MQRNNDTYRDKSNHRWQEIVWLLFLVILGSATALAHPMGNFSVNHYAKIKIGQRTIEIRYLIDMAEIPTFQEIRQFNINTRTEDPSVVHYLDRQERVLMD